MLKNQKCFFLFSEAGLDISSLLETLPSTKLSDTGVKERVQAIVETVLQQPQVIKETASKYVDDLHSNLDTDADGVVSVNDLAVKACVYTFFFSHLRAA